MEVQQWTRQVLTHIRQRSDTTHHHQDHHISIINIIINLISTISPIHITINMDGMDFTHGDNESVGSRRRSLSFSVVFMGV